MTEKERIGLELLTQLNRAETAENITAEERIAFQATIDHLTSKLAISRDQIRRACAGIAAAEYSYWRDLPDNPDPVLQSIQLGSMGAAANICAAIFLGKSPEEHAANCAARPYTGVKPDPARTDPPAKG